MDDPTPIERLVRRLDLEPRDAEEFHSPNPGEGRRLFGGLVAAQSVVAAGRTVEDARPLHSLHAYFLRPGRPGIPIRFQVTRLKDGRNFSARTVFAWQAEEIIFTLHASFARRESGIAHQDPVPDAPPPDEAELRTDRPGEPFEMRHCDPEVDGSGAPLPASRRNWMRALGPIPTDELTRTALLVYASDRSLISTGARPHGLNRGHRRSASLDHALWLHHVPALDDWLLYCMQSPVAQSGRVLVHGAFYTRDGMRIASAAQEGLIRVS